MSQKRAMHGQQVLIESANNDTTVYLAILDWQSPDVNNPAGNALFKRKKFIKWIAQELGLYIEDALHPETTGYFNNESGERA